MHKMTQPKLYNRANKLWIKFTLNGELVRKSLNLDNTKANTKLANTQIIPQMILKISSGEFFENENVKQVPTIDEFAEVSFKLHEHHRKLSTLDRISSNYKKHILPHFKGKEITKVKPSDISLWQNTLLKKNLSPKRVKDIRTVLSVIFEDALHDEIIMHNPVRRATQLPRQDSPIIIPFSLDEIKKILEHAQGQFKNFFAVAFFTGMRTGEIIGLKWEDINFDTMELSVNRTIGKGIISTPKTRDSKRTIEILTVLRPYIKEQFKLSGSKNSYVFLNRNDTHFFDSNKIRSYSWKDTLLKANVDYRTVYNTRHTFASMMISQGEDILWVSFMLGHTNTEMTLRKYAKYIKNDKKKRAVFLNNF
ncbi:MAG: site-specific integrase [Epsilonproteobacteria bacterium]|nr:MAG: site-specific integrase [Campylobacterota bacterium]